MKQELLKLQKALVDEYPDLEEIRKVSKLHSDIALFLVVLGVIAYLISSMILGGFMPFAMFFVLIIYIYIIMAFTPKREDYKKYFDSIKGSYIQKVLKYIDDSFEFKDSTMPIEDVLSSKLFNKNWASERTLQGEDYFEGYYKGIKVKISEIDFGYSESRKVDNFKKSVLMIADFNKSIKSETYIYDRGFMENENGSILLSKPKGVDVILENPAFESSFITTSIDEIEGRYILSYTFMERLLELKRYLSRNEIYVSFCANKVSILIYNKLLFEPKLSKSIYEDKTFNRFYNETFAILKTIEILKLNEKIWKN